MFNIQIAIWESQIYGTNGPLFVTLSVIQVVNAESLGPHNQGWHKIQNPPRDNPPSGCGGCPLVGFVFMFRFSHLPSPFLFKFSWQYKCIQASKNHSSGTYDFLVQFLIYSAGRKYLRLLLVNIQGRPPFIRSMYNWPSTWIHAYSCSGSKHCIKHFEIPGIGRLPAGQKASTNMSM